MIKRHKANWSWLVLGLVLILGLFTVSSVFADPFGIPGDPFAELTNPKEAAETTNVDPFANWSQSTYETNINQGNSLGETGVFMGFGAPVINTASREYLNEANGNLFLGRPVGNDEPMSMGQAEITQNIFQSDNNLFLNAQPSIFNTETALADPSVAEQAQMLSEKYWRTK